MAWPWARMVLNLWLGRNWVSMWWTKSRTRGDKMSKRGCWSNGHRECPSLHKHMRRLWSKAMSKNNKVIWGRSCRVKCTKCKPRQMPTSKLINKHWKRQKWRDTINRRCKLMLWIKSLHKCRHWKITTTYGSSNTRQLWACKSNTTQLLHQSMVIKHSSKCPRNRLMSSSLSMDSSSSKWRYGTTRTAPHCNHLQTRSSKTSIKAHPTTNLNQRLSGWFTNLWTVWFSEFLSIRCKHPTLSSTRHTHAATALSVQLVVAPTPIPSISIDSSILNY